MIDLYDMRFWRVSCFYMGHDWRSARYTHNQKAIELGWTFKMGYWSMGGYHYLRLRYGIDCIGLFFLFIISFQPPALLGHGYHKYFQPLAWDKGRGINIGLHLFWLFICFQSVYHSCAT